MNEIAQAILLKHQGKYADALTILENASVEDFEVICLKGEIEWELKNEDASLKWFLQAAKANPFSWLPFYYLGLYYKNPGAKQDLERARKCLQKSFSLNPNVQETGCALSDILRTQVSFFLRKIKPFLPLVNRFFCIKKSNNYDLCLIFCSD